MVELALAGSRPTIPSHLEQLRSLLSRVPVDRLQAASALLLEARKTGHRVYVTGLGGSASTAAHVACDLQKTAALRQALVPPTLA